MKIKTIKLWLQFIYYILISAILAKVTGADVNSFLIYLILFELLEWKCKNE